ncbi:oxidoreductase [Colletotrichum truncatum]|uniref:Oxidoreductase n=1 Tax=Colletotrichum truncatum TaxID=5467 RepID=A0ACC3Z2E6_COLTU|nr:oxidoreductase [Colletotrichum truncatum]KAF6780835.1 oxidoreductase [Colletotrichum truncatum]
MNRTTTSRPSRAILLLHGSGSSDAIFKFQTSKIRATLKDKFTFVFAKAPHPSEPGPGVLPFFAKMPPYFTWFRKGIEATKQEIGVFNQCIENTVLAWKAENPSGAIVGVLGFSQGGIASTLLLWEQQMGFAPWLPDLEFGILICSGYYEALTECMSDLSIDNHHGGQVSTTRLPTLHLYGRQDVFGAPSSKKMFATHFAVDSARMESFNGGHELPRDEDDLKLIRSFVTERIEANPR